MSDDIEATDEICLVCRHEAYQRRCDCEDGYSFHDCGEDSCACLNPHPNVRCDHCYGKGYLLWCRRCAWDLIAKRFLNGHDERTVDELKEDRAPFLVGRD